ncbi:MAG: hypothetical protein ABMB14_27195, partial [Myxococcota bacterium]
MWTIGVAGVAGVLGCRAGPDADVPGSDQDGGGTEVAATGDTATGDPTPPWPPAGAVADVQALAGTVIVGERTAANAGGPAIEVGGPGVPDLVIGAYAGSVVWRFVGPLPAGEVTVEAA